MDRKILVNKKRSIGWTQIEVLRDKYEKLINGEACSRSEINYGTSNILNQRILAMINNTKGGYKTRN